MVAELGQAFRQQVLHPFVAGVVLAVDQVQHAHGAGPRGRVAWRQRRQRGQQRRAANGNLGIVIDGLAMHANGSS